MKGVTDILVSREACLREVLGGAWPVCVCHESLLSTPHTGETCRRCSTEQQCAARSHHSGLTAGTQILIIIIIIITMLTRRKESDTYLATVSRHHWSREITMKIDKI